MICQAQVYVGPIAGGQLSWTKFDNEDFITHTGLGCASKIIFHIVPRLCWAKAHKFLSPLILQLKLEAIDDC